MYYEKMEQEILIGATFNWTRA